MEYRTHDGVYVFRGWFAAQGAEFRAAFDTTRRHLSVTETWTVEEGAKDLEDKHAGLTELLIDIDVRAPGAARLSKRRFRPVGVRIDERHVFLLLGACEKIARIYYPAEAFDDALKHLRNWEKGIGVADDLDI